MRLTMTEIVRIFDGNALTQKAIDERIENLVLYNTLLKLVERYGILAVVEAFEQVGEVMTSGDEK